jgi:hypothetical protein
MSRDNTRETQEKEKKKSPPRMLFPGGDRQRLLAVVHPDAVNDYDPFLFKELLQVFR